MTAAINDRRFITKLQFIERKAHDQAWSRPFSNQPAAKPGLKVVRRENLNGNSARSGDGCRQRERENAYKHGRGGVVTCLFVELCHLIVTQTLARLAFDRGAVFRFSTGTAAMTRFGFRFASLAAFGLDTWNRAAPLGREQKHPHGKQ